MTRKWITLLLVAALILALAACTTPTASTPAGTTAPPGPGSTTKATDPPPAKAETLIMYFIDTGDRPDMALVVDEMNRISGEAINITVNATGIAISNYSQQIRLMLTGREKMDILNTSTLPFGDFGNQVANKQLLPLNDYIDEYGKGIKELVGNYLKAGTVGGDLLAIPTYRDLAKDAGVIVRKDLVEKYNLDVASVKKLADLEPLLVKIKENEPDLAPFYPTQEIYGGICTGLLVPGGDTLGSDQYWTGVLLDATDTSMKVVNYYETDAYMELVKLMYSWAQKGLISPTAVTNQETPTDLVKAGKLASQVYHMKPGIERQGDTACGMPMTYIRIHEPVASTGTPAAFMWSVAAHTEKPEASVKYLDFTFTNKEINDTFHWGIKDQHWTLTSDGHATFAPGLDAKTSGYVGQSGFVFGNSLLTYVWEGTPLDVWDQMMTYNKSAIQSVALGFQFDTTPIKTQFAACTNVGNEYIKAIGVGAVDPDVKVPELVSKLKAAGVDEIIAEKQRQLNAWAEANK